MAAPKNMTPEQRTERARKAGQASVAPEVLAKRLARNWGGLTEQQQAKFLTEITKQRTPAASK